MRKFLLLHFTPCLLMGTLFIASLHAQTKTFDSLSVLALKQQVIPLVAGKEKQVQEMVDMIFSFGELGFQEIETSKYLTDILSKNGLVLKKVLQVFLLPGLPGGAVAARLLHWAVILTAYPRHRKNRVLPTKIQ